MEQEKIGEFIAAQRKEKGMTQKQLGDALKISDKTVSKWECGKGLPDISIIMPLCELLNISVNELLSGEHLTEDSYPEKAEENMMQLIQETENQKRDSTRRYYFRTAAWILGNLLILLALIMTSASQKNFPIFFYYRYKPYGSRAVALVVAGWGFKGRDTIESVPPLAVFAGLLTSKGRFTFGCLTPLPPPPTRYLPHCNRGSNR